MYMRRRRPLARAAMVGGAAYYAGKRVQEGREDDAYRDARLEELEAQQAQQAQQAAPQAGGMSDNAIEQLVGDVRPALVDDEQRQHVMLRHPLSDPLDVLCERRRNVRLALPWQLHSLVAGDVRLAAQADLERRLRALGPANREPVLVLDDVHGARQGLNRVADGGRSGEEDLKR